MKSNSRIWALGSIALSVLLIMGAFVFVWLSQRVPVTASAQEAATPSATAQTPAQAPTPVVMAEVRPATITVRGSGVITVTPNVLVMNVGIVVQETTVKAAQTKVSAAINGMVSKLQAARIATGDYRTSQYSVDPVMGYNNTGKAQIPKLTGFRVTHMLEITFRDPASAPGVIDALVAVGANNIFNGGYTAPDAGNLYKQAYDKAMADAQVRAAKLAGLSSMTLGRVVSITEANANVPGVIYTGTSGMGAGMGGGGTGPIYPGQQIVQSDLIVTYEAK